MQFRKTANGLFERFFFTRRQTFSNEKKTIPEQVADLLSKPGVFSRRLLRFAGRSTAFESLPFAPLQLATYLYDFFQDRLGHRLLRMKLA